MSTAVDGIVTGLDTTSLIKSIVAAASTPKKAMESQLKDMESKREKVAGLQNRLTELSEKIAEINTPSTFIKNTVSTSSSLQFGVTADGDAVQGSWNILVKRLASNEMEVSQGLADATTVGSIQEGTYTLTYQGTTHEVALDGTTASLSKLATAFNDIDGITAYVLDTGDGASPYRLVVQGEDTGADSGITLGLTGASGAGELLSFTEEATAVDAWMTVNGVNVYAASNQVQDAIPGITLDLKDVGTTATALTVAEDLAGIEETVQSFVDAYNAVVEYYQTNTVYNAEEGIKGALIGDATARRVMDSLSTMVSAAYGVGTEVQSFGQLGVETQNDGKLTLDSDKLQAALAASYDDVISMFTADAGPVNTLKAAIDDVFVNEESGTLVSRGDSLQDSIDDMQLRIDDFDLYIENMSSRLRGRFTAMEIAMGEMQSTQTYLSALFAESKS